MATNEEMGPKGQLVEDPGVIKDYKEGGSVAVLSSDQRDAIQKGEYSPEALAQLYQNVEVPTGPAPADLPQNPILPGATIPSYTEGVAIGGIFDNIFPGSAPSLRPANEKPPEQK